MDRTGSVVHKGCIAVQNGYNNHILLFDNMTGNRIGHINCDEPLTNEELKEKIELFLKMTREVRNDG